MLLSHVICYQDRRHTARDTTVRVQSDPIPIPMLPETKQTVALFLYYFVSAGQLFVVFTICLFLCILWLLWEIVQNSQVSNTNQTFYDGYTHYDGYLDAMMSHGPYDLYHQFFLYGGNQSGEAAFFNEMIGNHPYMLDQGNWWDNLANCEHIRLIIPPDVIQDQTGPELFRQVTEGLTNAKNKLFGAAAQGLQKIRGKAKRSNGKGGEIITVTEEEKKDETTDNDNNNKNIQSTVDRY